MPAANIASVISSTKQGPITLFELMNRWGMSKIIAKATILATTQRLVRSLAEPSLNKRYNTNDRMLRYYRIRCNLFMDTFFALKELGPSIRGYTCSQLFVSDFGYVNAKMMKTFSPEISLQRCWDPEQDDL